MNRGLKMKGQQTQQMHNRLLNRKKIRENIYFCMTDIYIFMFLYINV